ncbi:MULTISPECIES: exodeoxyribonuclease V subunit gamma [unclassified Tepidimonas]|jgi:exodeoxyribonuclease V gamma subunit|uniref:exodeoxyribonuclease V subunit gamma n=1 Tax=unclassified Tepidimonas TaxID=2631705 RepID=UPI003C7B3D5E
MPTNHRENPSTDAVSGPGSRPHGGAPASGLVVVHGNRAERLLEVALQWNRQQPLPPLDNDVWLVPSHGVGQWIRQTMAAAPGGIAAGVEWLLPAQWLWQAYRAVLGTDAVPDTPVLAEGPLTWRLWRLLPTLTDEPFAPLRAYLANDTDGRKRGQLAHRLADLYDQYQVYRADWLADWAAGRDQWRDAHGRAHPLAPEQQWQSALWRRIRADLGADAQSIPSASRADIHAAFMAAALAGCGERPPGLPSRLTVFGLSALPPPVLEALAVAARWLPILVCVLNPCQYYWADTVPDAAWLARIDARWRERAARRPGSPAQLDEGTLAQHSHPLLAAWGRQGRDFIALLQAHEDRPLRDALDAQLRAWGNRVDLFDALPDGAEAASERATLLAQLQDDILHGRPLAETRQRWSAVDPTRDDSLRFHVCHTALREVEVLHDQVLAELHRDPTLQPRDILVMVPDVAVYAPLFHAVFGRIPRHDPRHVPYTISDWVEDAGTRLQQAVAELLALPRRRLGASEVLGWLDVPAFARRFRITLDQRERLQRWIADAGIRWGIDVAHRVQLGLVDPADAHAARLSWRDGLQRLWLGYVLGPDDTEWRGSVPVGGVSPLEVDGIERLQTVIDTLQRLTHSLATPTDAAAWVPRLLALLDDCFDVDAPQADPAEVRALQRLRSAALEWGLEAAAAGSEPLPLAVVAEAWLARAALPPPRQRFLNGTLTVATLLPMRAVPFRVIHLLGMDDASYPRRHTADDFDLMALHPRPGDRQRRHEDQYLFLEALLSARERLTLSWVGHSPVDDGERAPSALVAQLRQHIAAGWRLTGCDRDDAGDALLAALTTRHRLQPFDAAYFPATPDPRQPPPPGLPWFSYAHEWLPARQPRDDAATLPPWTPDAPLDTAQLGAFLRNPARAFFQQRLRVHLADAAPADDDRDILEPDGLSRWRMDTAWVAAVVRQARAGAPLKAALAAAEAVWRRAIARGEWPPGTFGDTLAGDWNTQARRVWSLAGEFFRRHPLAQTQPDWLDEPAPGCDPVVRVRDALGPVHRAEDGTRARLLWQGSAVIENPSGNGGQYRLHTLTSAWVQHLAHHRAGGPLATWVLSPRGAVVLSPLSPEQADAAWESLLRHWWAGMSAPCRFEPKSAAAWLRNEERAGARAAWLAARLVYEGNEHQRGVLDTDPDWRRACPDFAALAGPLDGAEHSPLAQTARALLRPLRDALSSPPRHDADDQP